MVGCLSELSGRKRVSEGVLGGEGGREGGRERGRGREEGRGGGRKGEGEGGRKRGRGEQEQSTYSIYPVITFLRTVTDEIQGGQADVALGHLGYVQHRIHEHVTVT